MSAIVEAVERLAVARGWLGTRGRPYNHDQQPPWVVHIPPAPLAHVTIGDFFEHLGWHVDPLTSLLWSLLVELDVEPIDVGACPTCVKRGARSTVFRVVDFEPCLTCSVDGKATGRALRHPARLLLEANGCDKPTCSKPACSEECAASRGGMVDGDAEARAHLAVLADMWDGGRATHAVEVAIPAKWVPHDLGPSLVVVRNDGKLGSIRQSPLGAPVTTTASGPCEVLVAVATTRIEARPLRVQARWLVSWVLGWPGDSSEVCGAEMAAAAANIWKRLTVPCRRCPGLHYSDRGGVHVIHCPHCGGHGRAPGGADSDRRDQLTTNGVTVVAEWGSSRAEALTRAQSAHEPVTISGLEYVVTGHSVDHTADPSSRGRVTFDLTRLRRVTTSATDTSVEVADVDLLPAMTDGGHETPPPE